MKKLMRCTIMNESQYGRRNQADDEVTEISSHSPRLTEMFELLKARLV